MKLFSLLRKDLQYKYKLQGIANPTIKFRHFMIGLADFRFWPVLICRLSRSLALNHLGLLAKLFGMINLVIFGLEITSRCEIDGGLYFPHTVGTIIGAQKLGKDVCIYQGVTIGAKHNDLKFSKAKRPIIGDNVVIGSGAKVLGGIKIGNNVVIGANSVVTKSIPDNAMVVGIPGKIVKLTSNAEIARDKVMAVV